MADAITFEWTGAPDASPSVKRVNGAVVATNTLPNPAFRNGLTGYATEPAVSAVQQSDGSMRVVTTTGTGQSFVIKNVPNNTDYTLVVVGRSFQGGLTAVYGGVPQGQQVPFTSQWATYYLDLTTADQGNLYMAVLSPGSYPGNGYDLKSLSLVPGKGYRGGYFDGSTIDVYASVSRSTTSTSASAGAVQFTPAVTRESTSTLTLEEDHEFMSIINRTFESDSAAWGSVPALLNVGYDSVGPFRVGDSTLTAWAIEVDSEVNLFGVFDSGEVTILNPHGEVVAVQPSPFIDNDTLIVTIPVGTFTMPGVFRLVPRLIGRGSVTLESVSIVIQADDGWQSLESARAVWKEAPVDDGYLYQLLEVARIQCVEFAPAFVGGAPSNYAQAQLLQARAVWASGNVSQGDQFGGDSLSVTVFPMDWTVKNLLRPTRAVRAFF